LRFDELIHYDFILPRAGQGQFRPWFTNWRARAGSEVTIVHQARNEAEHGGPGGIGLLDRRRARGASRRGLAGRRRAAGAHESL
jgi:hypothetical protein